jgi:hypothetical protein
MLRIAVNVTGDRTIAIFVVKSESLLNMYRFNQTQDLK